MDKKMKFILRNKHPALSSKKSFFSLVRAPTDFSEMVIMSNDLKAN